MSPALTPQQTAALAAIHQQLAALQAQEGKGGPALAALVAAIHASLVATYQTLLGIPVNK